MKVPEGPSGPLGRTGGVKNAGGTPAQQGGQPGRRDSDRGGGVGESGQPPSWTGLGSTPREGRTQTRRGEPPRAGPSWPRRPEARPTCSPRRTGTRR